MRTTLYTYIEDDTPVVAAWLEEKFMHFVGMFNVASVFTDRYLQLCM